MVMTTVMKTPITMMILCLLVVVSHVMICCGHVVDHDQNDDHHAHTDVEHIHATPSLVQPGITDTLTINCTLSDCRSSGITKIISLAISSSQEGSENVDLASISHYSDGKPVLFPSSGDASAQGLIGDEASYLSVAWDYPGRESARDYRCVAHALDAQGLIVKLEDTVSVLVDEPDLEALVEHIRLEQIQTKKGIVRKLDALSSSVKPQKPETCLDVKSDRPREVVVLKSGLEVMCDTQTDGGGWIVFQRRTNGEVDFYRGWDEYKYGFGDMGGTDFWFGNEKVHRLTFKRRYELRVDLKFDGKDYHAHYDHFRLFGEKERYRLEVSGYSGTGGDQMLYMNGMAFSTKDSDSDTSTSEHCAQLYLGAWWYTACHNSNLNGNWGNKEYAKGLTWHTLTGYHETVTFSEMKIRPIS